MQQLIKLKSLILWIATIKTTYKKKRTYFLKKNLSKILNFFLTSNVDFKISQELKPSNLRIKIFQIMHIKYKKKSPNNSSSQIFFFTNLTYFQNRLRTDAAYICFLSRYPRHPHFLPVRSAWYDDKQTTTSPPSARYCRSAIFYQSNEATRSGRQPVTPGRSRSPPRTNFGTNHLRKKPREGPVRNFQKFRDFFTKLAAELPSLSFLSLSPDCPSPPGRIAAAEQLPARIQARGEVPRRRLSLLLERLLPGANAHARIAAAALGYLRRVRATPAPLRRFKRGGAAASGRAASVRVRLAQAHVLDRAGSPPASPPPQVQA